MVRRLQELWPLDDDHPWWVELWVERTMDDGQVYAVDFQVYGRAETCDPSTDEKVMHGHVKWDGCMNHSYDDQLDGCMLHTCGPSDADEWLGAMRQIWRLAGEMMPTTCDYMHELEDKQG